VSEINEKLRVLKKMNIPQNSGIIYRSYYFAVKAHGDQTYGDGPYENHLRKVAKLVNEFMGEYVSLSYQVDVFSTDPTKVTLTPAELEAVAYLHDILEDTDVDFETLENNFGNIVATIVWFLTDEKGTSRKERKIKTWHKIRKSLASVFVKLADRIANTEAAIEGNKPIIDMYRKEFPLFEAALYVPGQFEGMWERLRNAQNVKRKT
jgi:(p)ppGpp synthase/HD superfamily hydrolase